MYENFFSFQARPFSAAPNSKLYFPAEAIEHARHTLTQSIDRGDSAAVLIGPAGTGKSLLMHVLAEQYKRDFEVVLLASARLCTRRALLQNILFELKLPYRNMEEGELRLSLIDQLDPANSAGMLLLVDEAHTLPTRLLEEIRMITNLVREGDPRVRLVLAGTRALEEQLALPKLDSLNQRVASRCYLESMPMEDTVNMVRRQIVAVGGNPDEVFSSEAIEAIHRAADGIPRLINQLADHALLLASGGGQGRVSEDGVNEAWADLQQLPSPWNAQNSHPDGEPVGVGSAESMIEFGSLDDDELFTDETLNEREADGKADSAEFIPALGAADEDQEQAELRLAPISIPVGGATTSPESWELDGEPIEAIADVDTALQVPAEQADSIAATNTDDDVFATPVTVDSMDDPFLERFEDEEVVIESSLENVPAVVVPSGPLSQQFAEFCLAESNQVESGRGVSAEACEILTWSTAETEDMLETTVATVGVENLLCELASPIVTLGEPLIEAAKPEDQFGVAASEQPVEISDGVELSDNDEWEPSFSAISTDDAEASQVEVDIDVDLPGEDLIDESMIAVDDQELIVIEDDGAIDSSQERGRRAQAIVKDYRQLFAQLRRD